MKKSLIAISFTTISLFLQATLVWAGGATLYEIGTPDMGTAAAGRAASAQDASTAWGNPAGMSFLDRSQLLIGFMPFVIDMRFNPDSSTIGDDGGQQGGAMIGNGTFQVHKFSDDLAVGYAIGSYSGMTMDPDDNWVGRYSIQDLGLVTMGVFPSVSYKLTDWFSVGGGPSLIYGKIRAKMAINNPGPGMGDGEMEFKDDSWTVSGQLGFMLEPRKGTRIGVAWRGPAEFEFYGDPHFRDIGPVLSTILYNTGMSGSEIKMKIRLPHEIMTSVYHEVNDKLAVMGNFGWQDWNHFGGVTLNIRTVNDTSVSKKIPFEDTFHYALGAQYRIAEKWLLSTGWAYDTSCVQDSNRTVALPMDRQIRYGTGIQYDVNEKVTIGAAYTLIDFGQSKVSKQGTLTGLTSGDYDAYGHFANVNMIWRF